PPDNVVARAGHVCFGHLSHPARRRSLSSGPGCLSASVFGSRPGPRSRCHKVDALRIATQERGRLGFVEPNGESPNGCTRPAELRAERHAIARRRMPTALVLGLTAVVALVFGVVGTRATTRPTMEGEDDA